MPVSLTSGLSLTGIQSQPVHAGSAEPASDDTFASLAVADDGWTLDATLLGAVAGGSYSGLNEFSAPGGSLAVTRKAPTPADPTATTDFDVPLTSVKRKPYADGADRQEAANSSDLDTAFSLASFIYANESVSALFEAGFFTDDGAGGSSAENSGGSAEVTNNSGLDYPEPILTWLTPPMQRIDASDWAPRLAVDHWYARNGRPVYAVVFTATDEHANSVSSTVTSMTSGQYSASGLYANWFEPDWDLSSLAEGDVVTINATIYPWVGDVFTISTDGFADPSPNISVLKALCDVGGTYGTVYAYVDGTGAGTPQASTNPATAAANPFASIYDAASAGITLNNSTYGRNNTSGVNVRIPAATVITGLGSDALDSLAEGDLALVIEGVTRATSIYMNEATSANNDAPAKLEFRNLTIRKQASTPALQGKNTLASQLVFDHVTFDANSTSYYAAWMVKCGREYFVECDGDAIGQGAHFSTNVGGTALAVGCDFIPQDAYNAVACKGTSLKTPTGLGDPKGMCCPNNYITNDDTGSDYNGNCVEIGGIDLGVYGLSLTGCLLEKYNMTSTAATLWLFGDNDVTPLENAILRGVGAYGRKSNILYQDTGTAAILKSANLSFSCHKDLNMKSDYFGTESGNRIGNWAARHWVDCENMFIENGDSAANTVPGYAFWLGEALGDGKNEMRDGTVLLGDPDFADDQSETGTYPGDYEPSGSSVIPAIPAGKAWASVDLFGTAIPDDGTGVAGPVQRTS